jgi:DNA-binding MarR family transcriptional regulator
MNDSESRPALNAKSSEPTIYSLLSAAHALEDRLESCLAQVGLSTPKFSVLSALVESPAPLSLSDLASKLSCVRSNMTQLVDRLESDGLVQRVHCPNDRRSVKAEITSLGRERQVSGEAAVAALHAEFAATVTAADRSAVERMLLALA